MGGTNKMGIKKGSLSTRITDELRILLRPLLGTRHVGKRFEGKRILLDAAAYEDCTLVDCELVFYGYYCVMRGCSVIGVSTTLCGPAGTTLNYLRLLYNSGGDGSVCNAIEKAIEGAGR